MIEHVFVHAVISFVSSLPVFAIGFFLGASWQRGRWRRRYYLEERVDD